MQRIEMWLDQGMGSCCLKSPGARQVIIEAIQATNDLRCELDCFVVMPNHVHAVARPLMPAEDPLEKIVRSWKGVSSRGINESLGRIGALWQRESFDRIIRDEEHLWRVIQYIGSNPRKAGLSAIDAPSWIRPDWWQLGWRFEEAGQNIGKDGTSSLVG
jgi:putative transposase